MKTLNKTQQGFTLVELIIVIVILGILAVTAAPKFLNIAGDAKGGTLQAVAGSVTTANSLINAKAKIQGITDAAPAAPAATNLVYEGDTKVYLSYGFPVTAAFSTGGTNSTPVLTDGTLVDMWKALLDINTADFTIAAGAIEASTEFLIDSSAGTARKVIVIHPKDIALPANLTTSTASTPENSCYVYVLAATATDGPEVGAVTTGCSK